MNKLFEFIFAFVYADVSFKEPKSLVLCFFKAIVASIVIIVLMTFEVYFLITAVFILGCVSVVPLVLCLIFWDNFWGDVAWIYSNAWIAGVFLGGMTSGMFYLPIWIGSVFFIVFGLFFLIILGFYGGCSEHGVNCCDGCKCDCGFSICVVERSKNSKEDSHNSSQSIGDNTIIFKSSKNRNRISNKKQVTKEVKKGELPPIDENTIIFETTENILPAVNKDTIIFDSTDDK